MLRRVTVFGHQSLRKRMPAVNTALAKNGARPANIGYSSLSALVWGWTSPIDLLL